LSALKTSLESFTEPGKVSAASTDVAVSSTAEDVSHAGKLTSPPAPALDPHTDSVESQVSIQHAEPQEGIRASKEPVNKRYVPEGMTPATESVSSTSKEPTFPLEESMVTTATENVGRHGSHERNDVTPDKKAQFKETNVGSETAVADIVFDQKPVDAEPSSIADSAVVSSIVFDTQPVDQQNRSIVHGSELTMNSAINSSSFAPRIQIKRPFIDTKGDDIVAGIAEGKVADPSGASLILAPTPMPSRAAVNAAIIAPMSPVNNFDIAIVHGIVEHSREASEGATPEAADIAITVSDVPSPSPPVNQEDAMELEKQMDLVVTVRSAAKKDIKEWIDKFTESTGRAPATKDKESVRHLYVAYIKVSICIALDLCKFSLMWVCSHPSQATRELEKLEAKLDTFQAGKADGPPSRRPLGPRKSRKASVLTSDSAAIAASEPISEASGSESESNTSDSTSGRLSRRMSRRPSRRTSIETVPGLEAYIKEQSAKRSMAKKAIQAWTESFVKEHDGTTPTAEDKEAIRPLYLAHVKVRC
jgi:hypothetical protein